MVAGAGLQRLKLQNNGLSNKLSIERPVDMGGSTAECEPAIYGVPKKARANLADGDWSAVVDSNPDSARPIRTPTRST